jgi:outer membrane protein assembly factor BamD (BamD/ComL family)
LASDDADLQNKLAIDLHERGDGVRAARLYQRILERIQKDSDAEAWITYQTADALRMGRDYEGATAFVERANTLAGRLQDADLMERIALLDTQLAQDLGDCSRALSTLEHFVHAYPKSIHFRDASRTLQAIRQGEAMECTRGA